MKKSFKKLLLLMAVVITAVVCLAFEAGALAETGICGENNDNVMWTYNKKTGTVVISGTGRMKDYDIRDYYGNGLSPFANEPNIKSVVVEDGVTYIGNNAFYCCDNVTELTIGKDLKGIGWDVFKRYYNNRYCNTIEKINLPDIEAWCNLICDPGEIFVGDTALYLNGKPITDITIPASVEKIKSKAFENCKTLKSVKFENGATAIEENAFAGCEKLETVVISKSVTTIGPKAFYECFSLKNVTIPDSVKTIGESAFACLTNVKFPKATDKGNVFSGSFSKFSWKADKRTGVVEVRGKGALPSFGDAGAPWSKSFPNAQKIVFFEGITDVGKYAFDDNLMEVVIPEGVKVIGYEAFRSCDNLRKVTLSDSVEVIGQKAFQGCGNLKEIKLGKALESIEYAAFWGCFSLKEIVFPKSLERLGSESFYSCGSLKEVVVPESLTEVSGHVFSQCSGIETAKVDSDVSTGMFSGCSNLKTITLGKNVTWIGEAAFRFCSSLEKIAIPYNVKEIAYSAFDSTLKEITVYSKDCKFHPECGLTYENTVYGFKGSTTEKFADDIGAKFVDVEKVHTHKNKTATTKATLTANGKVVEKCTLCGDTNTTTIYSPKTIKLSKTAYTYNGKAKTPSVTVKDSKGNTLKNGTDYKVTYEKGRKNPGKYTVRIDFIGNYSGTKRVYFTIAPSTPAITKTAQSTDAIRLTWNKVTGATGYRVYQYNSKTKKYEKIKTLKGTTYRVEKLKSGTAYKFKIKAYIKDGDTIWGKATDVITVATKPSTPKITKLTASKAKAAFTWSDVSGESGYQIYCSTKKDSGFKKVASYKANVVKGIKSNLKSGKKYYFKVRAYKTVGETKVYSAWSAVKAVKIK